MRIRFLSSNPHKIDEAVAILAPLGVQVVPVKAKIEELQTADMAALAHDKCVRAFKEIGHPLFVEHTGLKIDALRGLPGGLTQLFWDTLEADEFAAQFGREGNNTLSAHTRVAFCDGKKVFGFDGSIDGTVPPAPRGDRAFQWDCVFVPQGHSETFAEMGMERKNKISMRFKALSGFASYLRGK